MANKKPSKVILAKCIYPLVKKVAQFEPAFFEDAVEALDGYNERIVAKGIDNQAEFYFINARIEGATHIFTKSDLNNFPSNDPDIVAKLDEYLKSEAPINDKGSARKRGRDFGKYD